MELKWAHHLLLCVHRLLSPALTFCKCDPKWPFSIIAALNAAFQVILTGACSTSVAGVHWKIQPFCCVEFIVVAISMELYNFIWAWHSCCQAIGKQHLWMGSAAVQTVPGVPRQHRGTCLLSSRIHRANSSGFHHCPLFYALYSTSEEDIIS